jgi:hypothetical protein
MEKDPVLKLPEPYVTHTKKIHDRMDLFAKNNTIRKWSSSLIDQLFFLYLFKKYKNNCITHHQSRKSYMADLGVQLYIKQRMGKEDKEFYNSYLNKVIEDISDCIDRTKKTLIIPFSIIVGNVGHANILIYRKKTNVIERFEPHGSEYQSKKPIQSSLFKSITDFIEKLNHSLTKKGIHTVTFVNANEVCPYVKGLQGLEEDIMDKLKKEGTGYCAAWSMFFAELALKNQELNSNQLIEIIYKKISTPSGGEYLRKMIRGYVNYIYDKIDQYFLDIYGEKITGELLSKLKNDDSKRAKFVSLTNMLITMETDMSKNDNMTKENYIKFIEDFQDHNTNNVNDIRTTTEYLEFVKKTVFEPSPASSQIQPLKLIPSSSSSHTEKRKAKKYSNLFSSSDSSSSSSTPLSSIKLESLESVSSYQNTPNCPEGKIYDNEKRRCVKILKAKSRSSSKNRSRSSSNSSSKTRAKARTRTKTRAKKKMSGSPAYVPGSPAYVPGSPAYVNGSPAYVPGSPAYVNGSPAYVPGSPAYVPGSPAYVPGSPAYVPGSQSPVYNTGSPAYVPGSQSPVYNTGSQSPSYYYLPPEKNAKVANGKYVFSSVKRRQTKKHHK